MFVLTIFERGVNIIQLYYFTISGFDGDRQRRNANAAKFVLSLPLSQEISVDKKGQHTKSKCTHLVVIQFF